MARKAKQKAQSGTEADVEAVTARPEIAVTDLSVQVYVNAAVVSHSQHEFAVAFARLPTKLSAAELKSLKETGIIHASAEVQVTFAPTVLPGLIQALTTQLEKYEKRFGKIKQ